MNPKTKFDFWGTKHAIDDEVARLGWSKDQCVSLIITRYGKITRLVMTDDELLDLLAYLKSIPTPTSNQSKLSIKSKSKRRKRI